MCFTIIILKLQICDSKSVNPYILKNIFVKKKHITKRFEIFS